MNVSRNQIFKVVGIAVLVFAALALLIPTDKFVRILNGAVVGIAFGVGSALWPLIHRAFHRRYFDRVDQLAVGIVLSWISVMLSRLANALPSIYPQITMEEVGRSMLVAVAAYLGVLAGVFHVTSAGMVDDPNDPPEGPGRLVYNKRLLYISTGIGAIVGLVLIFLKRS